MGTRKTFPADEIANMLKKLVAAIVGRHRDTPDLVTLGIANGGVTLSHRLNAGIADALGRPVPHGIINVAFHRDDVGRNPIPKMAAQTMIPCDLEGASVILVDDVLFSGRTVRAALEEVFAHGRPTRVELAVLVDRGNHRLPVAADYCGIIETTRPEERVTVALDDATPERDSITISNPNPA